MDSERIADLEAEVEALKAQVDRHWSGFLALTVSVLVVAVGVLAIAAGRSALERPAPPLPDVPRFRGLEIVDERGQVRMMMAPDSGELSLMSPSGEPVMILMAPEDGLPFLTMFPRRSTGESIEMGYSTSGPFLEVQRSDGSRGALGVRP